MTLKFNISYTSDKVRHLSKKKDRAMCHVFLYSLIFFAVVLTRKWSRQKQTRVRRPLNHFPSYSQLDSSDKMKKVLRLYNM